MITKSALFISLAVNVFMLTHAFGETGRSLQSLRERSREYNASGIEHDDRVAEKLLTHTEKRMAAVVADLLTHPEVRSSLDEQTRRELKEMYSVSWDLEEEAKRLRILLSWADYDIENDFDGDGYPDNY